MKKLNLRKPLFTVKGDEVEVIKKFPNGNIVVFVKGRPFAFTVDEYGWSIGPVSLRQQKIVNELPEIVEYVSVYPNDQVYRSKTGAVQTSSYGVENLIQVKVTRRGGKVVAKELC